MAAQRRGGTGLANRSAQRVEHRVRLSRAGHDNRDDRRIEQRGDGQGIGMGGHVGEAVEARVVDLLVSAGRLEPDHLDEDRVEEVRDRRIVECQVAVLADPRADDIGRFRSEDLFIVQARLERPVDLLAGN